MPIVVARVLMPLVVVAAFFLGLNVPNLPPGSGAALGLLTLVAHLLTYATPPPPPEGRGEG